MSKTAHKNQRLNIFNPQDIIQSNSQIMLISVQYLEGSQSLWVKCRIVRQRLQMRNLISTPSTDVNENVHF
jgi:hypothetical protein